MANKPSKLALLKELHVFKGLPEETLVRIEKLCAWKSYQPGESILNHLDANDDVFFLIAGEARVSVFSLAGKAVTFCDISAGDMFGEYAAIDGAPRSAGIEARTACVVGCMSGAAFRALIETENVVALTLLRQAVAKIRTLSTRVYEFSTLAVSNRIQAELLRLARLADDGAGRAKITLSSTHADIASRTSTHREAVTRELNRLARDGILERQGKTLIVTNISRLNQLIHEATGE